MTTRDEQDDVDAASFVEAAAEHLGGTPSPAPHKSRAKMRAEIHALLEELTGPDLALVAYLADVLRLRRHRRGAT